MPWTVDKGKVLKIKSALNMVTVIFIPICTYTRTIHIMQ